MPNITEHKTLNTDKMLREQPLLIYINISHYDTTLSDRPTKLKELFKITYIIMMSKKFLICKEGILDIHFHLTKISFLTNHEYFYIYIFHNLNNHNNTSYISVL